MRKKDKKRAMELFTQIVQKIPTTALKDEMQNQITLLGEEMPKPVPLTPPPAKDPTK